MKRFVLLLALVASVWADGAHHHHAPAEAGPTAPHHGGPPPTSSYAESPPVPASSYGAPEHTAGGDQQGYYYYYYPVQDHKTKGLFDLKKDNDLLFIIVISLLIVGAIVLGLSYIGVNKARTFDPIHVSYQDMYDVARKVYQALSKKY